MILYCGTYCDRLPRWLNDKELCLPIQEIQVWSLGQKDPLEKEVATHSSILAWKVPWTEEPGGPQSMGLHNWAASQKQHILWCYVICSKCCPLHSMKVSLLPTAADARCERSIPHKPCTSCLGSPLIARESDSPWIQLILSIPSGT